MSKYYVGIPDEAFIRGKIPMTKEEIRVITLGKLRLENNHEIIDIGAGTGSVSIEMAKIANKGRVIAVEKEAEGVSLIKENMNKFDVTNIDVIHGKAPEALESINHLLDRVFIGGSGGNIDEVIQWSTEHLKDNGRIVINTITIENTFKSIKKLQQLNYKNLDVAHVSISKGDFIKDITLMKSLNPIYVISADKE